MRHCEERAAVLFVSARARELFRGLVGEAMIDLRLIRAAWE